MSTAVSKAPMRPRTRAFFPLITTKRRRLARQARAKASRPLFPGALDAEAVLVAHWEDAHPGGMVEGDENLVADGVALGEPADGVQGGLSVADLPQAAAPLLAAAGAQKGGADAYCVQTDASGGHEGGGAGGMDQAGVQMGGVEGVQNGLEHLHLTGGVICGGAQMGVSTGNVTLDRYW